MGPLLSADNGATPEDLSGTDPLLVVLLLVGAVVGLAVVLAVTWFRVRRRSGNDSCG